MALSPAERQRRYRERHPERAKAAQRAYYANHVEQERARSERWHAENPGYHGRYSARRYAEDPNFRLRVLLRSRVRQGVQHHYKAGSAVRDLGCTVEELKKHLESKFRPGMTWENWGEWEVDHMRPLASFDLTDRAQFLQACHYTNLQPLWKSENRIKGDRC